MSFRCGHDCDASGFTNVHSLMFNVTNINGLDKIQP